MLLDFKEIPQANSGSGFQDTFELFSRDFLELLGFEILQHPYRGADGKKDMIVQETRQGITGVTKVKWLVSCKHYIFSGKSVNDTDEPDINDRLLSHKCNGFLGVYSTLPATSLNTKLQNSGNEFQVYDRERLEKVILNSPEGNKLASRYFPKSYQNYRSENPSPATIFSNPESIHCEYCNKDLLANRNGIYVLLKDEMQLDAEENPIKRKDKDMYFCCKGDCDYILKNKYRKNHNLYDAGWEDISDICVPTIWLTRLMAFMNNIQSEQDMDDIAYKKMKYMFIKAFPYIARELTTAEKERVSSLNQFGLL